VSQQHYARIADLYDAFVRSEIDVPFFVNEAKKANGEILELMAGTGRVTLPLVKAGMQVTCVDFSAEMLEPLRQKLKAQGLIADVHQMDVRQLEIGKRFPLVMIPFQAFPELTTEDDQQRALARIHAHLTDDGRFICTLHNPAVRLKSVDGQLRLAGKFAVEDGLLFVWLLQRYAPETQVVEVLEFFEEYDAQGVMRSKRWSELQFHMLEKSKFERLIDDAGFAVVDLYGDYQYAAFHEDTSPFMIWMLRRR
jgi:SAM-dependent methyltransferase